MAAPTRTPRDSWIQEGLKALAAGGPDAVRVETLAQALGVTKGGFYWHFDGRQALLDEMLDLWERELVDDVIARVESRDGHGRAKLGHLFSLAGAIGERLKIELAVRDWARRDRAVARRLRRVDNRRMDYMRPLFAEFCADEDDAEARTFLAFSLFVGSNFVAAEHGERTRPDVMRLATDRLLGESWA